MDEEDDDDEMRLVKDLFNENDNRNVKNVRPAKEKDLPVEVKFGIAYTQVVDLVGFLRRLEAPIGIITIEFFLFSFFWCFA